MFRGWIAIPPITFGGCGDLRGRVSWPFLRPAIAFVSGGGYPDGLGASRS